jgi:hypothetical protein
VDLVPLGEEQLGEVAAVLAGDPGDERLPRHGRSDSRGWPSDDRPGTFAARVDDGCPPAPSDERPGGPDLRNAGGGGGPRAAGDIVHPRHRRPGAGALHRFESRRTPTAWSDATAGFDPGVAGSGLRGDRSSLDLAVRVPGDAGRDGAVEGFTVSPSDATHGTVFSTQPVVAVQDANGNTVAGDSTSEVTVSKTSGAPVAGGFPGTILGDTGVTASTGVATFTDLAVKGAGTAYQLHATATGLEPADSLAFDITTRAITVTAAGGADGTKPFDCDTTRPKIVGNAHYCTPTIPPSSLATGDTATWIQTFDTSRSRGPARRSPRPAR